MSLNLTGVKEETKFGYDEEVQVLADELEDLISWGINTEREIKGYLRSDETWNSENQLGNVENALDYLEEESRVAKSFKKYGEVDIAYKLIE